MRRFNEQKHKSHQASLQQSLDLLKVYTSAAGHLQKGGEKEKQLATKVVEVAKKYNEHIRQAKEPPTTVSQILKQFFLKVAGKRAYTPFIHNEIHIPTTSEFIAASPYKVTRRDQSSDKILSVLQSVQRNSDADYSLPKQHELDLFRTKGISLCCQDHTIPISLQEAIHLTKTTPIEHTLEEGVYLLSDNIILLRQTLLILPGIEVELAGSFQRDPFHPELAIPVKGSFQRTNSIEQTGFPHPMQYIGIALHEKLLPNCILRPHMCPKFEKLLKQKYEISQKLLPNGQLYKKAKALLKQKKELFNNSPELFSKVSKLLNLFPGIQPLEYTATWYDTLSQRSAEFCENTIANPIRRLQDEWLVKNNAGILSNPYEESYSILLNCLQQAKQPPLTFYTEETIETIGKACIQLHLMQLSEHLHFEPKDLSDFERMLLVSLLRQQLIFMYELEETFDEKNLYDHLQTVIKDETALFMGNASSDEFTQDAQELANELYQYYSVRFETLPESAITTNTYK